MATVLVNNKPVEIGSERLNCIQAADRAGVEIPHYCYHHDLSVVASCRMCLVEMGDLKDGKVAITPKVFPGCQTPVKDGTVIVTGDYAKRDTSFPTLGYPDNYKPGDRAKKAQADTKTDHFITNSVRPESHVGAGNHNQIDDRTCQHIGDACA